MSNNNQCHKCSYIFGLFSYKNQCPECQNYFCSTCIDFALVTEKESKKGNSATASNFCETCQKT